MSDTTSAVLENKNCSCASSRSSGHTHEHGHAHDHDAHHHDREEECRDPFAATGCGCPSHERAAAAKADGHGHDHGHDHGDEAFSWTWRIIVPGLIFAGALLGRGWLDVTFGPYAFLGIMLFAYLLCGLPMLREAGEALLRKDFFNEFTLMAMASIVAILIGEVVEAVGVMLFYSLGEAVQERAAGRSRHSIKSLLASKPQTARIMRNDTVEEVRPEQVAIGSTILVKPGEKVPLDGVVVSGRANLDMSSLTGESVPVSVEGDAQVYSGSICLDGDLVIRTTARYADSMVGRILAMVENAVAMKSRTERFITRFARYYTPSVVGAAVLVALVPPLAFGQDWHTWIYRALVLLMVSCPCALFLSVPLAFFAGIGAASRQGMLVKGGQVFDALARAKTVVFDKTGTLTEGRLSLERCEPAAGVSEAEVLRLAALAESRSNHPVARAILEAAGAEGAFHEDVTLRDVAGKGVVASAKEGEILVGNAKLLRDAGVAFTETGGSDVASYVALNGEYKGCLTFADHLKKDSVAALRELKHGLGVKLYMLTGDREEAAARVAEEVGLDGYRAGLLPDEKVKAFRELSPEGHAVFVGDGVNDAPVLAASGVGVAMGALGSAAAVEAADAVLLDDSPAHLPKLFKIAARTRWIAGENIVVALGIKAVIMVLGILGISGLWAAVFADVGVALLAVLNSMRLARA